MNHVKLNLAQIEEIGDLVGFTIRQFQMQKANASDAPKTIAKQEVAPQKIKKVFVENGKKIIKMIDAPVTESVNTSVSNEKVWVDENATIQYTKNGYEFTGQKRMSYCPPEWIADKQGGGFLLLDDWNRADIRFIQAVMDLIDRQEYVSWKLPKDWHIILTANPDDGKYIVQARVIAQMTRFMSISMKFDVQCWAKWAENQQLDNRCINFMLFIGHERVTKSEDGAVNPRALTNFFNSISSMKSFEDNLSMIQNLGEGSVGPEVAQLFTTFIHNKMDKWITPKEILTDSNDGKVIQVLKDMFDVDNEYRADIASVLTTRLINYSIMYAEDNSITPEILKRLSILIKDKDVFTDDLRYHLVKKILNGNKQKFQKLLIDQTIQELATK